jgi:hypothetical protein
LDTEDFDKILSKGHCLMSTSVMGCIIPNPLRRKESFC